MINIRYSRTNQTQAKYFVIDRPDGIGYYDLVFFKSKVNISVVEEIVEYPPNTIIIYDKTCKQYYYASENDLISDFIHFDIEDEIAESLFSNIPLNKPISIQQAETVEKLIWLITFEFYSKFPHSKNNTSHLFTVLFKKIEEDFKSLSQKNHTENHPAVTLVRTKILRTPQYNWTIKELAESCNMSESYFQIIYKKIFGTNCISDVILARLEMAQRYLLLSEFSVQEISVRCGYNNIEHFTRQFKKEFGITPLKYRKKHKHISQILPEMQMGK